MSLATMFVQQMDADNWTIQINGLKNEENSVFIDNSFSSENAPTTPGLMPPLLQKLRSVFSPTVCGIVPPMEKITEYINLFSSLGYNLIGTSSHGSHPKTQTFMLTFRHSPVQEQ